MNFQSKKTSQFAHHMANARCGMVLPILVTVICMTVLFYYAMDPGLQIKVLETALYHFPTEKLENNVTRENNKVPSNVSDTVLIDEVPNKQVEKHPIYFFGDSLYDTGMGFHIGFGPMADSYPYGKTYFKRPAGRFSDGLLIPDFIARFAELPLPEPYANPLLVEYTNAVNFAGTSGCVLVDSRNNSLNLKMQTDLFEEMVGRMEEEYGVEKTKKLVSKAVLVFNIGSNDYTDFWIFNEKPFNSSLVDSFTNKVLGNLTTSVTRMYKKGARKFAFQNYGPIGCIPLYLRPDGSCAEDLNELATQHNARFATLAMEWTRRLPGFKFIIYDFYTSLTARVRHGSKYGFKETQTACCGSGQFNSKFTCMERSNFTLCDDISSHLFFDPAHPTQHADMQFAQEFWSGTPDVVTPVNLKTLLLDEE